MLILQSLYMSCSFYVANMSRHKRCFLFHKRFFDLDTTKNDKYCKEVSSRKLLCMVYWLNLISLHLLSPKRLWTHWQAGCTNSCASSCPHECCPLTWVWVLGGEAQWTGHVHLWQMQLKLLLSSTDLQLFIPIIFSLRLFPSIAIP